MDEIAKELYECLLARVFAAAEQPDGMTERERQAIDAFLDATAEDDNVTTD